MSWAIKLNLEYGYMLTVWNFNMIQRETQATYNLYNACVPQGGTSTKGFNTTNLIRHLDGWMGAGSGEQLLAMMETKYSKALGEPANSRYYLKAVKYIRCDPYTLYKMNFSSRLSDLPVFSHCE